MARVRIQVLLDESEKAQFEAQAIRESESLGGWLRKAAHARLAESRRVRADSPDELRAFFRACDEREQGTEPDWAEHLAVMEASQARGRGSS